MATVSQGGLWPYALNCLLSNVGSCSALQNAQLCVNADSCVLVTSAGNITSNDVTPSVSLSSRTISVSCRFRNVQAGVTITGFRVLSGNTVVIEITGLNIPVQYQGDVEIVVNEQMSNVGDVVIGGNTIPGALQLSFNGINGNVVPDTVQVQGQNLSGQCASVQNLGYDAANRKSSVRVEYTGFGNTTQITGATLVFQAHSGGTVTAQYTVSNVDLPQNASVTLTLTFQTQQTVQ